MLFNILNDEQKGSAKNKAKKKMFLQKKENNFLQTLDLK